MRSRLYSLRELAGVVTIAMTIAACGLYCVTYPKDPYTRKIAVQVPLAVLPGVWLWVGTVAAGTKAPFPLPLTALCLPPVLVSLVFLTLILSEWLFLLPLPAGCRTVNVSEITAWEGPWVSLPFAGVVLAYGLVVRFVRRDDSPAGGDPVT